MSCLQLLICHLYAPLFETFLFAMSSVLACYHRRVCFYVNISSVFHKKNDFKEQQLSPMCRKVFVTLGLGTSSTSHLD